MKIGILETGHVPADLVARHGTYPDMMARRLAPFGFTTRTWSVVEGTFPDSAAQAEGWLIPGSRHGVYDDLPWIAPLEQLIREIVAADLPLVGICFGHQVIARALGGRVEKFEGGWAIGPIRYAFPDGIRQLHAWHQDQVITPPEGAQTCASNEFCAHAALLYPGKAYTVQPHPEFDDAYTQALITHRGPGVVPDAALTQAQNGLGTPIDNDVMFAEFARFFRERSLK